MNTDNYDDIINLPHHVSATHPQMPMANRAAQFAPFAALTGHAETLEGRLKAIDDYDHCLVMADGNAIPLHLVAGIDMLL